MKMSRDSNANLNAEEKGNRELIVKKVLCFVFYVARNTDREEFLLSFEAEPSVFIETL